VKNSNILGALLMKHPDEPVLLNMLIDALMEEQGIGKELAVIIADCVREKGEEARQLAQAAELIAEGSSLRVALLDAICRAAKVPRPYSATVLLTPGRTRPHANGLPKRTDHSYWGGWTVTVGATWLLDEVKRQGLAAN
jgi:hypothetical protein